MYNKVRILFWGGTRVRQQVKKLLFTTSIALLVTPISAYAHPGRTDANGGHTCHLNWRNGDYSTNIIITINQLLVVVQRAQLSSQNNNSAVEAERQAEAQRNTEAEKQRAAEAQRKAEEERQRVAEEQRKLKRHVSKRKRSAKLIWKRST